VFDSVDLLLVGEVPERTVTASIEEVVCFGAVIPEGRWNARCLSVALVVSLRWKTATPSSTLGSPEAVMGGTMANNVFCFSDVLTVVVQGGVEGVCRGYLSIYHAGTSVPARSLSLEATLIVGSKELTNGGLMRSGGVLTGVGSLCVHTIDPASNLV